MIPFFLVLLAVLLGISVVRGAPYVPTHKPQIEIALDLLDLKPGEHLVDVGSGDGSVLLAAARRGLRATGYEINPLLVLWARFRARKYRKLVTVRWRDMWQTPLPKDTNGIFVFTMGRYMPRLEKKILEEDLKGVRLASHAFKINDRTPDETREAVMLYTIK